MTRVRRELFRLHPVVATQAIQGPAVAVVRRTRRHGTLSQRP